MLGRFAFLRTTTFKLALLYAGLFAAFAAGLLLYLYVSTVLYLRSQADERIEAEMAALTAAHTAGGLERLNQSIIERASAPGGQFFYLLQDPVGQKISGDLSALPPGANVGPDMPILFEYDVREFNGEIETRRAEGRLARLGQDAVVFVAFDIGQRDQIVNRITLAVYTAGILGLILSLVGGAAISRGASRRAEALAKTAEDVMAGDLSIRAPVRGSGDEFDRLAERLNAMLDRIERLMYSVRHSSDAIAHDLRSPLSRLRNRVESALAGPLTREHAEGAFGETLEDIDQVLGTFNAILRLSRLDAGAEGRLVRMDVAEVARQIAELFEPACEAGELGFKSRIDNGLWVLGDRDLLAQALANLIDNAIKYTPAGGAIRLEARRGREGGITCSVTDTGPGVPVADREKIVRRFERLDSARTQAGSGLGLSLVDAIAELHSGELQLLNGDGPADAPGLKVVLRLPRAN